MSIQFPAWPNNIEQKCGSINKAGGKNEARQAFQAHKSVVIPMKTDMYACTERHP